MLDSPQLNETVNSWLIHSEVKKDAKILDELPHHDPEAGWCAIIKVLNKTESDMYLSPLSVCLRSLINHHGEEFIERIEAQSLKDSRFKACLAEIRSYSETRISRMLLERLANAAGVNLRSFVPNAEKTLEHIPNLAEALYATPFISEQNIITFLTDNDLERIAQNWIKYHETLWASKEIDRIIKDEFIEYAFNVTMILYQNSTSNNHLCAIGSGPLEALLKKNGALIIDRIEQLASTDRRFKVCLSNVWSTNIASDIWKRIVKASRNGSNGDNLSLLG